MYNPQYLPCLPRKIKEADVEVRACLTFGYYKAALWEHTVCLESLSVMSRMRNVAVWFVTHAAGSSISGSISHSASLTPSALLQYPHFFLPSLHPSPLLLFTCLFSDHKRAPFTLPLPHPLPFSSLFSLLFSATTCVLYYESESLLK